MSTSTGRFGRPAWSHVSRGEQSASTLTGQDRNHLEVLSRQDLGVLSDASVDDLEPGDLLFGRGHQAISKIVAMLNGYWSHTAIYVGGTDRLVVSSTIPGIVFEPIESFLSHYPTGGAGFARPQVSELSRRRAAEWAIAKAVPLNTVPGYADAEQSQLGDCTDDAVPYNARDLGLAAALLLRAIWTEVHLREFGAGEADTAAHTGAVGNVASAGNDPAQTPTDNKSVDTTNAPQTWTCAGFVYDAYWEGAGVRLTPSFLKTVEVHGNTCAVAGRPSPRRRRRLPKRGDVSERLERGRRVCRVVGGAVPELRKAWSADLAVEVTAALGPNDLWHSGDLQTRWALPTETTTQVADPLGPRELTGGQQDRRGA